MLYIVFSSLVSMAAFYFSWKLVVRKSGNKFVALGVAFLGYVGTVLILKWISSTNPLIHSFFLENMIQFENSTSLTFVHIGYIHLGLIAILAIFCWLRSPGTK